MSVNKKKSVDPMIVRKPGEAAKKQPLKIVVEVVSEDELAGAFVGEGELVEVTEYDESGDGGEEYVDEVYELRNDEGETEDAAEILAAAGFTEDEVKQTKSKRGKKGWSKRKKIVVGVAGAIGALVLLAGVFVVLVLGKTTEVFNGSLVDLVFSNRTEFRKDAYGRSNILVFGTAEDEPGHGGSLLTDSIIILSVDQEAGDAKMFSLPRDLWVEYDLACSVGYRGKINAAWLCGLQEYGDDADLAAGYFGRLVEEVTGVEIQYYVAVDWSVVRDVVDTLGGIDVEIWTHDPRGIYDPAAHLTLPAGVNHLDGAKALALARARNAKGGYGLTMSNFDREKNQQRIINAIKEKALSIGFLANPVNVLNLIDSLGANLKTNISLAEIKEGLNFAMEMGEVKGIDLSDLFKTGMIGEASVVVPAEGSVDNPYVYGEVRDYLRRALDGEVTDEDSGEGEAGE